MKKFTESVSFDTWTKIFNGIAKDIQKCFKDNDIGIFDYILEPAKNITIKYYLTYYPDNFEEIINYLNEISITINKIDVKDHLEYTKTTEYRSDVGETYNIIKIVINFESIQKNTNFKNLLKSYQTVGKYKL